MSTEDNHPATMRERLQDHSNDLDSFLEIAKTLPEDTPGLTELLQLQYAIAQRMDGIIKDMRVATHTIESLLDILNVQLPALVEIAHTDLNPHGNHYNTLKGIVQDANRAVNKVRAPLKALSK